MIVSKNEVGVLPAVVLPTSKNAIADLLGWRTVVFHSSTVDTGVRIVVAPFGQKFQLHSAQSFLFKNFEVASNCHTILN